jgi:predicted MFS family arabinose efflux permease
MARQPRLHPAWLVLGVTFLIMLVTAGTRAAPGVLLLPLQQAFGWDLGTISGALSVNLALFGLMGPFAAAAMQRFGLRRSVLAALALLCLGVAASGWMRHSWQLWLLWGLLVGSCTGVTAMTLGAVIVSRWFVEKRGFAMGLLTASSATGQLVFLPLLAALAERHGWRAVVWSVAGAAACVIPLLLWLLPESPAALGLRRYGEAADAPPPPPESSANPVAAAFAALRLASRKTDFWLLFGSFFVCGATTNGYVGTHFIAMCGDHGLSAVQGAGLLAAMGALDLVGTSLSGWLADRFDNRLLLCWYYGFRGLALLYLPYAFGFGLLGLPVFALLYGLDWVATVPPTARLTQDVFGARDAPIVFGWIGAGHQLGASFAALGGGLLRSDLGSYRAPTLAAGVLGLLAALLVLRIRRVAVAAPAR